MGTIDSIEDFILNEKRAVRWHWGWLAIIVFIGVTLIMVNFIMGWIKEIGPNIGTAFILFLTRFPLVEVLRRRDRIAALKNMKVRYSQVNPGSIVDPNFRTMV